MYMKRKHLLRVIVLGIASCFSAVAMAQDPHFSQYFNSPSTINPALVGKDVGDMRVLGVFRSQWWGTAVAPFNTTALSIEKAYRPGKGGRSILGVGFSFLSDVSNSGLLKNNYFTATTAYNIALDGKGTEFLGIGLQGTYANRLIDASKFTYQSQFGSMGFQRSVPSGDPVNVASNTYWDMNAGLQYSKRFRGWGLNTGVSVFHGTTPVEGFYNGSKFNVERRINVQGGLQFYLDTLDEIHLSAITDLQGENTVTAIGAVYKAHLAPGNILNLGAWYRIGDAIYPYVSMQIKDCVIGFSYDVLVDFDMRKALYSVQSIEISFGWLFGKKRNPVTRPEKIISY
jgi:type IX secretion system PorP/SprF family membrane protein